MIRNHLVVACVVASFTAGAEPVVEPVIAQPVSPQRAEPSTALHLHLGTSGASTAAVVPAGMGWIGMHVPSAGLELERLIAAHWAVLLGVSGDFSRATNADYRFFGLGVEPGVRWYPGEGRLAGGWLALSVPLSWSDQTVAGWKMGVRGVGGALMLGWSFRAQNGLTASLSAGPVARLVRTWLDAGETQAESTSASVSLRGAVAVGDAF